MNRVLMSVLAITTVILLSFYAEAGNTDLVFTAPTPANGSLVSAPATIALTVNQPDPLYNFVMLNNDLELWLTFDENASVAVDHSTHQRNGTYRLNATRTTSVVRNGAGALYLESPLSNVQISSSINAAFDPSLGYTLAFWIYPTNQNSGGTIAGSLSGGNYQGTYFKLDNSTSGSGNRIYQSYGAGTSIGNLALNFRANEAIVGNQWHHVAFVNFRDYTMLYIDGKLKGGSSFPRGDSCNSQSCTNRSISPFYIGSVQSFGLPTGLQGYMDDFLVFSRPLQAQEVAQLYHADTEFSADVYSKPLSPLNVQGKSLSSSQGIMSSNILMLLPNTTAPYLYQAYHLFEPNKNLSSSGIFTTSSFYPQGASYVSTNSPFTAEVFYRKDNGPWTSLGQQPYQSFNPSEWSGVFGDSIMGPGGTGTWPRFLDLYLHSSFYPNVSLMNGVGGYRCWQVLEQFTLKGRNNTKAIINCGANDANDPNLPIETSLGNISAILTLAHNRNISVYLVGTTPRAEPAICDKIQAINAHFLWWYTQNNTDNFIKGFADVYNTSLKSANGCTYNQTYFVDLVHPNDAGNLVIAQTVWQQAFRGATYDGWYAEFAPSVAGAYDLKWTISSPEGQSSSKIFASAFRIGRPVRQAINSKPFEKSCGPLPASC